MTRNNTNANDVGRIETPKVGAVEEWEQTLAEFPDEEWADELRGADIHDSQDRMDIEEIIEYEVPEEHYLPLHDAFDSLQTHFDDWW